MRCSIYARVSTQEQRERKTIAPQLETLPTYAAAQGWTVMETYTDDGVSGESIVGRPEFQRLLRDAEDRRFDIVLVSDHDRLARPEWEADRAYIHDHFRRCGVKIATPSSLIDLDQEDEAFMFVVKSGMATLEKRKIVKRMRSGKRSKLQAGKFVDGSLPFGYQVNKETKAVEIDPINGPLYQRIVRMILGDGLSLNKVCARLNAEEVRSPLGRRWSSTPLSRILHNPGYQGTLISQRYASRFEWRDSVRRPGQKVRRRFITERPEADWIKIPVPPLITPEEWTALQQRIRASRSNNFHYATPSRAAEAYLLRGTAYCGLCRSKLMMRAGTAEGSRYYFCYWSQPHAQQAHRGGTGKICPLPWIPAASAERSPVEILTHALLMPEEIVERYAKLVTGEAYAEQVRRRLAEVTREEKRVKDQERRLLDKGLRKLFSPEILQEKAAELVSRREWLAAQQQTLHAELADQEAKQYTLAWMGDQSRALFHHRKTLEAWWTTATPGQRQRLMRALIDPDSGGRVLVYPPPVGYTADPNLNPDPWGGRVECRFTFDPARLLTCLESLGVVHGHDGSAKGAKQCCPRGRCLHGRGRGGYRPRPSLLLHGRLA